MTQHKIVDSLAALAEDITPEVDAVEVHEDVDGRETLSLYLDAEAVDRDLLIEEANTLPPWADVFAVDVGYYDRQRHTPDDRPEAVADADVVVAVGIHDRRDEDDVEALVGMGLTPSVALDYWATNTRGYTQDEWADHRGVKQASVSENASKARDQFGGR